MDITTSLITDRAWKTCLLISTGLGPSVVANISRSCSFLFSAPLPLLLDGHLDSDSDSMCTAPTRTVLCRADAACLVLEPRSDGPVRLTARLEPRWRDLTRT